MSTKVVKNPKLYDVISSPVITEKSQMGVEQNKVTLKVSVDATKAEVKQAVESIFGVEVKKVNIINVKGKNKVFRGVRGRRNDVKKAVITLAEGHQLDVTSGI